MREKPEPRLLKIAGDITDQTPVDWETVRAGWPDLGARLERMRALEALAGAHRRAAGRPVPGEGGANGVAASDQERTPLFTWGPLRVLERLGEGGFAEVFRAWDPTLQREVALKLRRQDPDAADHVAHRWLDEARRLARVRHPNVLVVHGADIHAGRAGLWTDLVEGQTLEASLAEQGPLGEGEATRIGVELCRALTAVHAVGLVHADVKTKNVMREGAAVSPDGVAAAGRIVLMDFGAASERGAAGGEASLFGTPLTSAPEVLDGAVPTPASDLYSLGVLLYRLVTGRYPLEGKSVAELREQFAPGKRPALGQARPDLPIRFVQVVEQALAPDPAARFADAGEMERALAGVIDAAAGTTPLHLRARTLVKATMLAAGASALLVIALALITGLWSHQSLRSSGQEVVAVFPFRVDSSDPSIGYLREGMVDLLAAKLTGEAGPRAADPRTVLSAWRRAVKSERDDLPESEALRLARRLGARQTLFGSVVGSPGRLTLSATLVSLAGGMSTAAEAEGPTDSLPTLIDRLTAQLLSRSAGQPEYQLGDLTTRSLPALRSYLAGQASYRRGDYEKAVDQFKQALDTDTTFSLAGVGLSLASWWGVEPGQQEVAWAWAGRNRLNMRDRALLVAELGPRFPSPSPASEMLAARERAVAVAPDRAEAWCELGDELYRAGSLTGRQGSWDRARLAFHRAVKLDSTYAGPLEELVEMAARDGDDTAVRNLGALSLRVDPAGDDADYVRWQMARVLGDHAALAGLRVRFHRMGWQSLFAILWASQVQGTDLDDADRISQILIDGAVRGVGRWRTLSWAIRLALNRGRPGKAVALSEAARELEPFPNAIRMQYITQALFWDGDSSAAVRAARELGNAADALPAGTRQDREAHLAIAARVQLWRLAHGELETASRVIAQLRAAATPAVSETTVASSVYWAAMLEATLASAQARSDAGLLVQRLDSLMAMGPYWDMPVTCLGNLIAAQLLERQGDLHGALAAIRRRAPDEELLLSTFLHEEGRLAALTGDREGAIRAYRQYLALRSDPEPALVPQIQRVREALERLETKL